MKYVLLTTLTVMMTLFIFADNNPFYNGDFSKIIPNKRANIKGKSFPASWSGGNNVELVDKKIKFPFNGFIYQNINVGTQTVQTKLQGTIKIKGNGIVEIKTSTCIMKPNEKKSFTHDIRKTIKSEKLTGEIHTIDFEKIFEPYEVGYFYIHANDAELLEVTGTITPVETKE